MTQKQNGVLEWLQSCETPAPSEPKIKAVIVAGKSYMNSSEFNKNSMRDIILNQLQFLPLSFWIVQIILTICAVLLACILGQWRVPLLSIDNPCSYGSIPCVIRCNRNI